MTHGLEGRCSIQLSYGRICHNPKCVRLKEWSVMQDSNLRPLGPKPSALPSCANHRLRYTTATGRNITTHLWQRQTIFSPRQFVCLLFEPSVFFLLKTTAL